MHNSMRSATIGTEQCNDLRTSIDCRLNRRSCANAMHQRKCLMRAIHMIGKSIAALISITANNATTISASTSIDRNLQRRM
jgi:hypothetical protein